MSTYKAIRGLTIHTVAGDPSPLTTGDIWYSSTTRKIRGAKLAAGAWAAGGDLNTSRYNLTGCGLQTAALTFGGTGGTQLTESYDGSSWTEVNAMSDARTQTTSGQGTQTAALVAGENASPYLATEEWNGTSWTAGGDIADAVAFRSGAGTQTAGLVFGGGTIDPNQTPQTSTEEYNGSAWTEGGAMNTGRIYFAGGGVQTAALAFGGNNTAVANNELYNGSTWTEIGDLNTARKQLAASTNGTSTAMLAMTGTVPGVTANVEEFDGVAWAEQANVSTGRQGLSGAGTSAAGLAISGYNPATANAEEWTKAQNVEVITD